MKKLVLLATLLLSNHVFAAQRVAERYTCTAFNPLTGYATITFTEKGRGRAHMESLVGKHEIYGGRLMYDTSTYTSHPRAIFNVPVDGQTVSVYMDLVRPLRDNCEGRLSEEILTGITYIPLYGASWNLSFFAPLSPAIGASPLLPVPMGFVPTSFVTCRVVFKE